MPCKHNQKEATVTILMSHKVDFRTKNKTRDKKEYFIMTQSTIKKTK